MAATVVSPPVRSSTLSLTFNSATLYKSSCIPRKRHLLVSNVSLTNPRNRTTIASLPIVGSDSLSEPLLKYNIEETDCKDFIILCEIKEGLFNPNKTIAIATMPGKTFLAGDGVGDKINYPLLSSSGKIKGEIILSHELTPPGIVRDNVSSPVISVDDEGDGDGDGDGGDRGGAEKKSMKVLKVLAYLLSIGNNLWDIFSDIF